MTVCDTCDTNVVVLFHPVSGSQMSAEVDFMLQIDILIDLFFSSQGRDGSAGLPGTPGQKVSLNPSTDQMSV